MSSPWGKIATPAAANFAAIMSEEYAHRMQDKDLKRFEKICDAADRKQREQTVVKQRADEQAIWDNVPGSSNSNGAVSYSAAAASAAASTTVPKQQPSPPKPSAVDSDSDWEDCAELLAQADACAAEDLPAELLQLLCLEDKADATGCDSDETIAMLLQAQNDLEYNEELKRIEAARNKQSKVSVSLCNYRRGDLQFLDADDEGEEEDEDEYEADSDKREWDRFDTNDKILDAIPKCGYKVDKEGELVTKHDERLCGVRNACRVMSFPPEFATGDGAGFDMKLSNQVFNQLKSYSQRGSGGSGKKNKLSDRRENLATAEMGVDAATRMLLYKLINNQILEQINGIVATGKEALILHANSDPAYDGSRNEANSQRVAPAFASPRLLPKECAIKIFKTTLNEFKQRDRYIRDDFRFKDRFKRKNSNNRVVINMWAEKEMLNLMRMHDVGINCPEVIVLKRHVLVMSFIGDHHNAAAKLKDARLSEAQLSCAYEEIVQMMYKLYNEAKLVHADLSEYNILWYADKCWFIDVAQAVEPGHASALEFLMRDCGNIINFFTKRGLPNIFTKEELFEHISSLNAEQYNTAMLERIHTRGASRKEATAPNQDECPDELKALSYPFDLAWDKSQADKEKREAKLQCKSADAAVQESNKAAVAAAAAK